MAPPTALVVVPLSGNLSTKLLLAPAVCGYVATSRRTIHNEAIASRKYSEEDVVIIGGGLVGTAMACALGCSKILSEKRVLLLEGAPAPSRRYVMSPTFSNRVSAVNPSSVGLFKDLGIWANIESQRVREIKKMQVWDALSNASINFSRENMAEPVAHVVENDLLLSALSERLKDFHNVDVMYGSKITKIVLPKSLTDVPTVIFEDGRRIRCQLLIGADGVNSKVRACMATKFSEFSYNQMGVVATLMLSEPTDNYVAWQRFLPTGPIALLPLSPEFSSLVWATNPAHAKQLLGLSKESFVDAVNEAFLKEYLMDGKIKTMYEKLNLLLETLGLTPNDIVQLPPKVKYVEERSRAAFPLGVGHASKYVNDCVALIGDAAHRVHPLAGQGVNLGFGDVHSLAHLVEGAVYRGDHIGHGKHLLVYESDRQSSNLGKVHGIDLLHRLYSTSFAPIVALRSLGLSLVNSSTSLKKRIMQQAST